MLAALALTAVLTSGVCPVPRQSSGSVPAARPDPVLTIADVLARVRTRSPGIEAARTRQRASIQGRAVLPWLPNPSVEIRGENLGAASPAPLERDIFATVSQPVEIGGQRRARTAEADAIVGVANAEVTSAEWLTAFDVAQLYVDAVRARDVMASLVTQRDGVAELVAMLGKRVDEGVSPESDLRKFETEQRRLSSQVTRASIDLRSALLRLSAFADVEIQPDHLVSPIVASGADARATVTEVAITARPDVQIAMARLQRADATAAMARALGRPDLVVSGGYKRTEGADTGVVGVSMAVPFFNRNRVAVAYAAGESAAARLELEQVRQLAFADAQARWAAAGELARQAERAERELVEPAGVVRTAARAAFVEGSGDLLALVDAERVFGEASREALELRLDAALALVHARLAIGESPLP